MRSKEEMPFAIRFPSQRRSGTEMASCPDMDSISVVLAPLTWGFATLAALLSLAVLRTPGSMPLRRGCAAALLLGSLALLLACVDPRLLPVAGTAVLADGTTHDPRIYSAIALGLASLFVLLDAIRALELPPIRLVGALTPGFLCAALLASIAYYLGLRQPLGIYSLCIAGFGVGTALLAGMQLMSDAARTFAVAQALGTVLLAAGATLSAYGARAHSLRLTEGTAIDTLGQHIAFERADAPSKDERRLHVTLDDGKHRMSCVAVLYGKKTAASGRDSSSATELHAIAGGRFGAGPIVVPMALHETHAEPHQITWVKKGESIAAGDFMLRLTGFRMVPGDTIRMLADFAATRGGTTVTVSPGVYATPKGTRPFAATLAGFGPMTVAGIDADGGRVALMLPNHDPARVSRVAVIDVRLRPGLPLAWFGAAAALAMFLLGLRAPAPRPARG
jgi:hypothetical protein